MKILPLILTASTVTLVIGCKPQTPGTSDNGSVTPPPHSVPSNKPTPDAKKPETLVGVPLKVAEETAEKAGVKHRVVKVDGQARPVTMDFNPDRLNFTVVQGVVTEVTKG